MPAISASTKKYGTPMKPEADRRHVPMMRPSSIWPPSHALIFSATRSLISETRRARGAETAARRTRRRSASRPACRTSAAGCVTTPKMPPTNPHSVARHHGDRVAAAGRRLLQQILERGVGRIRPHAPAAAAPGPCTSGSSLPEFLRLAAIERRDHGRANAASAPITVA